MKKFPFMLKRHFPFGEDLPKIGFCHDGGFVFDGFSGPTGDPLRDFGIDLNVASALRVANDAISQAADSALDAGCKAIQEALGIADSDFAETFFSDGNDRSMMAFAFSDFFTAAYEKLCNEENQELDG